MIKNKQDKVDMGENGQCIICKSRYCSCPERQSDQSWIPIEQEWREKWHTYCNKHWAGSTNYKKVLLEVGEDFIAKALKERDEEMVNFVMKELPLDWKMLPLFTKREPSEKDIVSLAIRISKALDKNKIIERMEEMKIQNTVDTDGREYSGRKDFSLQKSKGWNEALFILLKELRKYNK